MTQAGNATLGLRTLSFRREGGAERDLPLRLSGANLPLHDQIPFLPAHATQERDGAAGAARKVERSISSRRRR